MKNRLLTKAVAGLVAGVIAMGLIPGYKAPLNADGITLSGTAHVQDLGDVEGTFADGVLKLGTIGQSKRLENVTINISGNDGIEGTLRYRVHIQNIGWQDWKEAGNIAGTSGQGLRLEGIQMELTGELAEKYVVYYSVHIEDYGDSQGWITGGMIAGTSGESKRLEELRVKLVPREEADMEPTVMYHVHRQDYGWETDWKTNGEVSGTTGEGKRLEAINISVLNTEYAGGIRYKTHVQDYGWQDWQYNGALSGTSGMGKRLEAIRIELTGELAENYNVYYRVHAQGYGWLDWTSNGREAGTEGLGFRLEAIQIVLLSKGEEDPGQLGGIKSVSNYAYYSAVSAIPLVPSSAYRAAGYSSSDEFRRAIINNCERMENVGYLHSGHWVTGYIDCTGSTAIAFRDALKTAKINGFADVGTRADGTAIRTVSVTYYDSYSDGRDQYGFYRNGIFSVNNYFLKKMVAWRGISYVPVAVNGGWSNDEWLDYLSKYNFKPGDVIIWYFDKADGRKSFEHMTIYAGIENGIAYEWTASSAYNGYIKRPLSERSALFGGFAMFRATNDNEAAIGMN
ncbi:MAG: hypothetical protein K5745_08725 [Saccharofermentans sp.]|nr:hypothetical protein [Saccharofermentans sp.]